MSKAGDENSIPRPDGAADRQVSVSKLPPPIRPLNTGRAMAERPSLGYTAAASLRAVDPHPTIPPEWLQLADAPCWIDRVHGVRSDAITRDLFLAVRIKYEIQHRVWCEWRYRYTSLILPDGLVYGDRSFPCIYVSNWETAGADWSNGTVGGWEQDDGTRARLPIEVPWKAVDWFVRPRLRGWKREAAEARAETDRDMSGMPRSNLTTVAGTVAAEKQMAEWLTILMRKNPSAPIPKKDALAAALKDDMREISKRAFQRAWVVAVANSGANKWSTGGSRGNRRT
jgi:hypothetical protein